MRRRGCGPRRVDGSGRRVESDTTPRERPAVIGLPLHEQLLSRAVCDLRPVSALDCLYPPGWRAGGHRQTAVCPRVPQATEKTQ